MQDTIRNSALILACLDAIVMMWAMSRSAKATLARDDIKQRWWRRTTGLSFDERRRMAECDSRIAIWRRVLTCGLAAAIVCVAVIIGSAPS